MKKFATWLGKMYNPQRCFYPLRSGRVPELRPSGGEPMKTRN